MKILVVGGGGREHALLKKLGESPRVTTLYAAPGNGGIGRMAQCAQIKATDIAAVAAFAKEKSIDLVVVAPDDPLVLGMVDELEAQGIPCFGPSKAAARIEGSKVFSKAFMKRYGIPTADYEAFDNLERALDYVDRLESWPVWIKADGLALGKGAVIAEDKQSAQATLVQLMGQKVFGDSGSRVVIEEHMTGPEATVLAFTDGETVVPMVSSMDHKRALDHDRGPNTGGMGAIAPNPHYTRELAARCMEEIFLPTIRGMAREGCPFQGCLYFGLMLTPGGPKVVEYNCRFGDPEAQVVLELLDSDLLEILLACRNRRLAETPVVWKPGAAACVIMASGGYPEQYATGFPISGLREDGGVEGASVCHAGTRWEDGQFYTAGGRVLGVTAAGADLAQALDRAYAAVGRVSFSGAHFRRDIGRK